MHWTAHSGPVHLQGAPDFHEVAGRAADDDTSGAAALPENGGGAHTSRGTGADAVAVEDHRTGRDRGGAREGHLQPRVQSRGRDFSRGKTREVRQWAVAAAGAGIRHRRGAGSLSRGEGARDEQEGEREEKVAS